MTNPIPFWIEEDQEEEKDIIESYNIPQIEDEISLTDEDEANEDDDVRIDLEIDPDDY